MSQRKRIHTLRIQPKRSSLLGRYRIECIYLNRMEHLITYDQFASRIGALNDLMPAHNPDRASLTYAFVSLLISLIIMICVFPWNMDKDKDGRLLKPTILLLIFGIFSLVSTVALYSFLHKKFINELHSKVEANLNYYNDFDKGQITWTLREWKNSTKGLCCCCLSFKEHTIEIEYVPAESLNGSSFSKQHETFQIE